MIGALVVSVHDVCPRTRPAVTRILRRLDALGVRRRSLLVIPAEPGGAVDEVPGCGSWLCRLAAAGDEIVQHGWCHARDAAAPPLRGRAGLLDSLLARGAGEFLDLDEAEAARRLADGRRRLAAVGLHSEGFVAPAWLYGEAAARAVAAEGFRYLTTHLRLRELPTGRDHWSFGMSNRPGAVGPDLVGRGVNEVLTVAHLPAPLVRVAVHPADLAGAAPFGHTCSLLRRLLALGRRPVTYLEYLDGW